MVNTVYWEWVFGPWVGLMSESVVATAYPEKWEYEEWRRDAEAMGMSVSEYIQAMIRAGRKKFSIQDPPESDRQDLRDSRDFYRAEVTRLRRRITELESPE